MLQKTYKSIEVAMIHIDVDEFAETGILPPFDSQSNIEEVKRVLGMPDGSVYPNFAKYGNLVFEFASPNGKLSGIRIEFPHPAQIKPEGAKGEQKTWGTSMDRWPDSRFSWKLERFLPGLTKDEVLDHFENYQEAEILTASDGLRILKNLDSGVDLFFKNDSETKRCILFMLVSYVIPEVQSARR